MPPPHRNTQPARRFARRWLASLKGSVGPAMSSAEIIELLARLAANIGDALTGDADPHAVGRQVGAALVGVNYRDVAVLNHTTRLLATHLTDDFAGVLAAVQPAALVDRLAIVQGAVAQGFASATQQRLLAEQETTQRAALAAARAAEQRRFNSEARFREVFAAAAVGIGMVGMDGVVTEVNPALADMLGIAPDRIRGRSIRDVLGPANLTATFTRYLALLSGEITRFRTETTHTRPDGRTTDIDLSMSVVRDSDGVPAYLIGVAIDVTERTRLQDQLWREARHDPLTGLPNRTLFFERLAEAAEPVGLCYLDLDGFKNVNDSFGHDCGDRLLIAVAHRLTTVVADQDGLVARLGGDEFVVLMRGPRSVERLARIADTIVDALATPVRLDATEVTVTGSVGVVDSTIAGTEPGALMRAADISLYRAKANGKGCWMRYDPTGGAAEITLRSLATTLPSSLARGEFRAEYQPIVRLRDGSIVGFEALARWNHPHLGPLPPNQFIPMAEESGHIIALGHWVLTTACRQARHWHDAFPEHPVYVSVNVAAPQLRRPAFVTEVLAVIDEAGIPPSRLQLELTETSVAGDTDTALAALRELSAAGIRLAIDDFGTGYSNLSRLGRLPVHQMKIDRSFLEQRPDGSVDPVQDKIVAATVSLGHALGLDVIAEGVETTAQAQWLRSLHCDGAQGWLFGKPVPADAAAQELGRARDR